MKNAKNAGILQDICPKKYLFPQFLGQFPALKLRVSGFDPDTNYVIMVDIVTGAIVLNKLFMRHLTLLHRISLDAGL